MTDPRRSCYRKTAYPTEAIAADVSRRINAKTGIAPTRTYGCTRCGFWHVGRSGWTVDIPIPERGTGYHEPKTLREHRRLHGVRR